jgi:hypothetical protein
LTRIARFCTRHQPPFIARISRTSTVQLLYDPKKGMK